MSDASDEPVARIPEGPLAEEMHIGERLSDEPREEAARSGATGEDQQPDDEARDDDQPADEQD